MPALGRELDRESLSSIERRTLPDPVELVDPADLPALREAMLETIEGFFEDDRNAVPMPYLRTTARAA